VDPNMRCGPMRGTSHIASVRAIPCSSEYAMSPAPGDIAYCVCSSEYAMWPDPGDIAYCVDEGDSK
jgi:hypothetical protein